jgi:hypothetical protein
MTRHLSLAVALLLLGLRPAAGQHASDTFVSLFNGVDLHGWSGDPQLWSVEDGMIVGRTAAADTLAHNQFLVWEGGELRDFELRARVRQTGNNSGIQYRSRRVPEAGRWVIAGYQLDVHPLQPNNGQLYEERGRKLIGRNGHTVVIDPAGEKWLCAATPPLATDVTAWNEYTIIARGNEIEHRINGQTVFRLLDFEAGPRALHGLLAFQLHAGPAMRVEIKDVRLKTLPPVSPRPFDPALIPPGAGKVPMPPAAPLAAP